MTLAEECIKATCPICLAQPGDPCIIIDGDGATFRAAQDGIPATHDARAVEWDNRRKPTIAWDFDGTLHPYTEGWTGSTPADELPIEGVVPIIHQLHDEGFRQVVFSARADHDEGHAGIVNWLNKHYLLDYFDDVSCKKPAAVAYVDDRAVAYRGSWGDVVDGIAALAAEYHHGRGTKKAGE